MNNKGFAIIEFLTIGIIILIFFILFVGIYNTATRTCLEYEEMPITRCYSMGGGTTCYAHTERLCVKYE